VPGAGAADATTVSEVEVCLVHLHDVVNAANPTMKRRERIVLIQL
jgi:hypothetical protein